MINIEVRLFAMLRESAGTALLTLTLDQGATVATARAAVAEQCPPLARLMSDIPVAVAVNRRYCDTDTPLRDGDELALIPPVSGGADTRVHAAVGREPARPDRLLRLVADRHAGATVLFQGTTRDVDALDYEAYADMAVPLMRNILAEVAADTGAIAIAAYHRLGTVPLGEASILVVSSGAHRQETFTAARTAVDRIKAEVPIWKRELEGGSATWVPGTPIDVSRTAAEDG